MAESRFKQYNSTGAHLDLSPPVGQIPELNAEPWRRCQIHMIKQEEKIVFPVVDDGIYQPKTNKTRAAYEKLLSLIQQPLPGQPLSGQPLSTVRFVADKILEILKNDAVNYRDKKINIEMLLNPIPNHVFEQIVEIGKLITDFYGFAAGAHVDGGVVDGLQNMSISNNNGSVVDGVHNLTLW
jgi:hypothetical protein